MVKQTFVQRLSGSSSSALPQDNINILLSDQRLHYVVADHLGQPHLLSAYHDAESGNGMDLLQSVFSLDPVFRNAYSSSNLILCTGEVALLPSGWSSGVESDDLYRPFVRKDLNAKLQRDSMPTVGAELGYHIPKTLETYANQMFPKMSFHHLNAIIISYLHKLDSPGDQVYLFCIDDFIVLVYLKDGALEFINRFEVKNSQDILYYTMLVYNQFGLDESEVVLRISSGLSNTNDPNALLRSYIQTIEELAYDTSAFTGIIHRNETTFSRFHLPLAASSVLFNLNQS